jgi:hypothetical protein
MRLGREDRLNKLIDLHCTLPASVIADVSVYYRDEVANPCKQSSRHGGRYRGSANRLRLFYATRYLTYT